MTTRRPWRDPDADRIRALVYRLLSDGIGSGAILASDADALVDALVAAELDDRGVKIAVYRWRQQGSDAAWRRVLARSRQRVEELAR